MSPETLDILVKVIVGANALAMGILSIVIASFRRMMDRLQHTDAELATRMNAVERDVVALNEWKAGHLTLHTSMIEEIKEIRRLMERLNDKLDEMR